MRSALLCGVLLATVASAAENESEPPSPPPPPPEVETHQTFVGLVPIGLSQGLIAIDGERVLSPKLSARVGLRFVGSFARHGNGDLLANNTQLLAGVEPGIRYYLTGSALDGLWLGPHLEFSYQRVTTSTPPGPTVTTDKTWGWGAGGAVLLGYSMVVTRGLTLQAGVGLGVTYSSSHLDLVGSSLNGGPGGPSSSFNSHSWTLAQRSTLAVGWSF